MIILAAFGYALFFLGIALCLTIVGIVPGLGMILTGLLMAHPYQARLKAARKAAAEA